MERVLLPYGDAAVRVGDFNMSTVSKRPNISPILTLSLGPVRFVGNKVKIDGKSSGSSRGDELAGRTFVASVLGMLSRG